MISCQGMHHSKSQELLDQRVYIAESLNFAAAAQTRFQVLRGELKLLRVETIAKICFKVGAKPLAIDFHCFLFRSNRFSRALFKRLRA